MLAAHTVEVLRCDTRRLGVFPLDLARVRFLLRPPLAGVSACVADAAQTDAGAANREAPGLGPGAGDTGRGARGRAPPFRVSSSSAATCYDLCVQKSKPLVLSPRGAPTARRALGDWGDLSPSCPVASRGQSLQSAEQTPRFLVPAGGTA